MRIGAILPRFPFPLEKGDKLRAYHLLKGLSRFHEIHLFAFSDQPVPSAAEDALATFTSSITVIPQRPWQLPGKLVRAWWRKMPLQCGYYYSPAHQRQLHQWLHTVQPDHLYFQLLRTAPYAAGLSIPATIDYMDAFAAGMQRRASTTHSPLRWLWQWEANRLKAWEKKVFPWFVHHTIISSQDRNLIHHPEHRSIQVITNGIDLEYFQHRNVAKDFDLVFAGNMAYPPNIRAAQLLAKTIVPQLLPVFPNLKLALVGTHPPAAVRHLANDHVTVTGWVDDIAAWYARAKVMVAPMEIGAGLQNKLLEAMAMGLPCITSPLAQRAMAPVTAKFVGVANDAQQYVAKITTLLQDDELRHSLGEQGRGYVTKAHNWNNISKQLHEIISGEP